MGATSTGIGLFSILISVLLAYLYARYLHNREQDRLKSILGGLLETERNASVGFTPTRVAVGLGGCRDVVVNASELLNLLNVKLPSNPYHVNTVSSLHDLENLFAYFFQHGAAVERYVSNKKFFSNVLSALNKIPASHKRQYVAGAAPTMAKRLQMEGAEVLLGSDFTKEALQEIPSQIHVAGSIIESDDLHIIMEYKLGEVIGPFTAPRDNRAIIHSDTSSPFLSALEKFADEIEIFKPSLVVVGGMQMMDNFPFEKGHRIKRLKLLRDFLKSLPLSVKVHLELASFAEADFMQELIEYLLPYVDSAGMNEQELPNVEAFLSGGNVTYVSDSKPRIATVLDHMRRLYSISRKQGQGRILTRLHIHTLAYQAIMVERGSDWKHSASAAAKASLTAHRYMCNDDNIDPERAKLLVDESFLTSTSDSHKRIHFHNDQPVSCWTENNQELCIAPVLVCTKVFRTAGGGDNISSAGLIFQI